MHCCRWAFIELEDNATSLGICFRGQVNLACEVLCRKWHFFRAQVYLAAIKGCEQVCRLKLALLGALVTRVVGHPRYGLLTPRYVNLLPRLPGACGPIL